MLGHELTRWSVRIALMLYLFSTAREIAKGRSDRASAAAWLAGSLVFLSHVFAAFYFHHGMSHAAALESTAERTHEMLGFAFGEGIYFSYLFTLLWFGDAIWRVAAADSYARRAAWIHNSIHLYIFFIALNGAAVFEAGATRVGAIVGCCLLAGVYLFTQRQEATSAKAALDAASAAGKFQEGGKSRS